MDLSTQAVQYHDQLLATEDGIQWHRDRGLSEKTIAQFRLGWITEPLSELATPYTGNPVIPYMAMGDRCIELKTRLRDVSKGKYRNVGRDFPLPTKVHLFNSRQAMPSPTDPRVFIVEGEYDAMIAVQCGLRAVAVPGVDKFALPWIHLFEHSEPVICMDGDEVGQLAASRLAGFFQQRKIQARVLTMPDDTDVTDLFLAGGEAGVKAVLR